MRPYVRFGEVDRVKGGQHVCGRFGAFRRVFGKQTEDEGVQSTGALPVVPGWGYRRGVDVLADDGDRIIA